MGVGDITEKALNDMSGVLNLSVLTKSANVLIEWIKKFD